MCIGGGAPNGPGVPATENDLLSQAAAEVASVPRKLVPRPGRNCRLEELRVGEDGWAGSATGRNEE